MDRRLFFLLNIAQQSLRKRVDEELLEQVGLTSAQAGVLQYLARNEGAVLKEIAAGVGIKSAAMTGLIQRIEQTGCIRMQFGEHDRRRTEVFLTPLGREKLDRIADLNLQLNRRLCDGFSDDDLDTVLRFLHHAIDLSQTSSEAGDGQ